MFSNFQIVLTGGIAILFLLYSAVVIFCLFYIFVLGGEISFASKGLLPLIKDWKEKRKNKKETK